ncbi:unnamed protein product, partial [Musa hybrid cultivar]
LSILQRLGPGDQTLEECVTFEVLNMYSILTSMNRSRAAIGTLICTQPKVVHRCMSEEMLGSSKLE